MTGSTWTTNDLLVLNRDLRRRLADYRLDIEFGLQPDLRAAVKAAAQRARVEHERDVRRVARSWRHEMSRRSGQAFYIANRRILLADAPSCIYCGEPATTADHVVSRRRGGSHELANLVPACHPCNSEKGPLSVDEWRDLRARKGRSWPPKWTFPQVKQA
jgi:5-methylcytosine-specific restriction endonuclease McrA